MAVRSRSISRSAAACRVSVGTSRRALSHTLPLAAWALGADLGAGMANPATAATYRCGNTYQQTPCATEQPHGSELKVFNDKPEDRDLFQAEVRRIGSDPYVAKYPSLYYYSWLSGTWSGKRLVNGQMVMLSDAMDDPDVIRLNGQIRAGLLRRRLKEIDDEYQSKMNDIRVQSDRRQKELALQQAQSKARRSCEVPSSGACRAANDELEAARKAALEIGLTPHL